jgi:hypothetical protein
VAVKSTLVGCAPAADLHRLEARVAGDAVVLALHGVDEGALHGVVSTSWRIW